MCPFVILIGMVSFIRTTVSWPQSKGPLLQLTGYAVIFFSSGPSSTCLTVSEMKVFHLNKYQGGTITMATRNKRFFRWKYRSGGKRGVIIYFTLNVIHARLIVENSLVY